MTTGAPNTAVTALIESSVGANMLRAMRSHSRQKAAPPRQHPGSTTSGLALPNSCLTRWGTAMPTKEMGPAKAVTQAASRLESSTSSREKALTLMPTLRA